MSRAIWIMWAWWLVLYTESKPGAILLIFMMVLDFLETRREERHRARIRAIWDAQELSAKEEEQQ